MSVFEDTDDLPLLCRRLVDRIDPDRALHRVMALRMSLNLGGSFVRYLYPGAFNSNAYLVQRIHERHAVFHNVPRPGDRILLKGETIYIFWRDRALQVFSERVSHPPG